MPVGVAALALLAGTISGWNIGYHGYPVYYSAAARSMSENWRAFFFGSFDPAATITLDKLAGFLVPQALSARIFGFHPWSIALPQVIEGMVTVVAAYVVGARWKSIRCGFFAGAAVTCTPLLAAMFARGSEDCLLTMSLTLAFLCWQSALLNGRIRPLLIAAVWVGIGFQAKMMQAWFIVPGLAVGYLLGAPLPLVERIRHCLLAGVLTAVVSLSWITAIQLVPATDRPYIDGTMNNNGYSMVFGYNGFNRIIPRLVPGAVANLSLQPDDRLVGSASVPDVGRAGYRTADTGAIVAAAFRPLSRDSHIVASAPAQVPSGSDATVSAADLVVNAEHSHAKVVLPFFLTQIGWFYPLALAGTALGWRSRRRLIGEVPAVHRSSGSPPDGGASGESTPDGAPTPDSTSPTQGASTTEGASPGQERSSGWRPFDASTATTAALAIWLLITAVFLSVVAIPHTAYLAAVSIQIALLSAAALAEAIRLRTVATLHARMVLPALMVVQITWTCVVLSTCGVAPPFAAPTVAGLGLLSVGLLLRGGAPGRPRSLSRAGLAIGLVAVLLAPMGWTGLVITKSDPVHSNPYAGPTPGSVVASARAEPGDLTERSFGIRAPFHIPGDAPDRAQTRLASYLRAHPGRSGPAMATDRWSAAEPYIELGGLQVHAFGGFAGQLSFPTLAQLKSLIDTGALDYALLHVPGPLDRRTGIGIEIGGGGFGKFEGNHTLTLVDWIRGHCRPVPTSDYLGPHLTLPGQRLYSCAGQRL